MRLTRSLTGLSVAAILAAGLAACSDDHPQNQSSGSGYGGGAVQAASLDTSGSQQQCFTEMTPEQKSQIVDFTNQNTSQVQSITNNPDGTQDICVLQPDGRGGYAEHYYNQHDTSIFRDYMYYAVMMRAVTGYGVSTQSLLTCGLIDGQLDPAQYLALSMLTGFDSYGNAYHPYSRTNAGWGRQRTPVQINNTTVHVTNVYYGKSTRAVPYSQSLRQSPPAGYRFATIPPASDTVAKVNSVGGRPGSMSTVAGQKASQDLYGASKVSTNAPNAPIPVPTKRSVTTTGGGSAVQPGTTRGGSTPYVRPTKKSGGSIFGGTSTRKTTTTGGTTKRR